MTQSGELVTVDPTNDEILHDIYTVTASAMRADQLLLADCCERLTQWFDYLVGSERLSDVCEIYSCLLSDPTFPKLVYRGAARHLRNKHRLELIHAN